MRYDSPLNGNQDRDRSSRRCLVTRESLPRDRLVRFVVGPADDIVPDVDGRLPGRGMWLSASRNVVNTAHTKQLFCKAARAKVNSTAELADQVERQLTRRCMSALGLGCRAGKVAIGFDRVHAMLARTDAAVVIAAIDGAVGGRAKIQALAPGVPVIALFTSLELGAAVGREAVVHAAIRPGRLAESFLKETGRLAGFRRTEIAMKGTTEVELQ